MEGDMQDKLAQPQLEDTQIVHAAPGEMVVPPVISNTTQQLINRDMQAVGLNPTDYVVGNGKINQLTGLQQFGFLSDVFKKVKKVVKKVAPIAVSFIPGVGPVAKAALTAVAGKASGMDTKDALLAGLTAGAGAKFAGSGSGSALKGLKGLKGSSGKFFGADGTFRNILGAGKEFILPGEDNKGLFKNIFGDRLGSGQMTGEVTTTVDDFGTPQYELNGRIVTRSELQQMGYSFDENNNPIAPQRKGLFGLGIGPKLRDTFLGTGEQGGLLSGLGQIGQGQGGMPGGLGALALAGLYGQFVKRAAEDREGGLTDIRASRRPDLMAQPVYQGFDLGVRKMAAYGGTAEGRPGFAKGGALNPELFELDYRQVGGPTIGIGTGTSDDIPAMLSDGEYVFTASANNGAGAFDISKSKDSIMLTPDGKPNREKGAKNLGTLMNMFEDTDKRLS
jgi:hypothetical protein